MIQKIKQFYPASILALLALIFVIVCVSYVIKYFHHNESLWIYLSQLEGIIKIIIVVFITLLISAFFTSFPLPAPGMIINEPGNLATVNLSIPAGTPQEKDKPNSFDVNISISPGLYGHIIFGSDFSGRMIKRLSWQPRLWLMVHKHSTRLWTLERKLRPFTDGPEIVPITLWVPNQTWDIDVISLNSEDDKYVMNYLAAIDLAHAQQQDIELPDSGVSIVHITVKTPSSAKLKHS